MVKVVRTLTGKVYYVSEPTRNEFDFKFLTTTELYLLSEEEQEKYLKDAFNHFPHIKPPVSEQTQLAGNDNVYFGLKTGREKSIH